jgi:hypothetical protein
MMAPRQLAEIRRHFPDSVWLSTEHADARVEGILRARGYTRTIEARSRSVMLKKLLDCLILSSSRHLLILDSDVLFFATPHALLDAVACGDRRSTFNRDIKSCYNISPEIAETRYGLKLVPCINAGLTLINKNALTLPMIEEFLNDPDILSDPWLTEQTLHALCASRIGANLLPEEYAISTGPGLITPTGTPVVAKHYPSFPRPYLYQEGMSRLIELGLIPNLSRQVPEIT